MSEKVYITPQGASNLRAELQYLWRDKRPKITQQVSAAAALGDRSENADTSMANGCFEKSTVESGFLKNGLMFWKLWIERPKILRKFFLAPGFDFSLTTMI